MQNRFSRVPEFATYYRNLSSYANKSFEDPILPHLLRSMYGLTTQCSSEMPAWNVVRDALQISEQVQTVHALLVTKVMKNLQTLGEFQLGRGLVLTPPFQDDFLPGESQKEDDTCFECQCQNVNLVPLGRKLLHWERMRSHVYFS